VRRLSSRADGRLERAIGKNRFGIWGKPTSPGGNHHAETGFSSRQSRS
jgi:hypothetical protein